MDMYHRNTTNITCKSNLVTRKHTLGSRMQEFKTEMLKQTSKIVLNKTKETINRYAEQTTLLLKNDVFRNNVVAIVGPVLYTTQKLGELNKAIKTNRENISEFSYNNCHSVSVLRRQLRIKKRIERQRLANNNGCINDNDKKHNKHHHHHHHHHQNHHHCHKCNDKENYFNDLYNQWAIIKINKYVDELMKENYCYLTRKLTKEHIDELIYSLNEFKITCNVGYIRIVDLYINIVQIIFSNVSLRNSLDTGEPVEKYKYDATILCYMEQLNKNLLSMRMLLEQQKKKYMIYDDKYGHPKDGLYDPTLLMEIDKIITDDLICSDSEDECNVKIKDKYEYNNHDSEIDSLSNSDTEPHSESESD